MGVSRQTTGTEQVKGFGPFTCAHEAIIPLIKLLQKANVPDSVIEQNTGLSLNDIKDPNLRVRLSVVDWLWEAVANARNDPAIGLNLIELYPENHMHFVAHLAMRAETVGQAILKWREYARLVCDADEITLSIERNNARLGYRLLDPRFTSRHHAEHYLSMAVFYGRKYCGKHLTVKRVNFRHADPGYKQALETYFGGNVFFDQNETEIIFDPAIIDLPNIMADHYLEAILSQQADAMSESLSVQDPVYKVKRWISAALSQSKKPTLSSAASDLALSERSLSRMLNQNETSFRELVDDLRRDMAIRYLQDGLSVTQTSYFLGFSDSAALHHAFARWFGGISIRDYMQNYDKCES